MYNLRFSKNPFESTINDLKMFEQTQFCYEYIEKRNNNKTKDELLLHAKISSACFRQANEYYKAANNVSLSTSPLLYSYALNNILKGIGYLMTFDASIINGFNKHGFEVEKKDIVENLLESKISLKKFGAVASLLKIFENSIDPQKIEFNKLLRHIPGITDTYFNTIGVIPLVALQSKNNTSEYFINGDKMNEELLKIMEHVGIVGTLDSKDKKYYCCMNLKAKTNIESGIYSKNNLYYKRYLVIPEVFDEEIKDINIAFYCYLLISAYGMLVRYNAHKWEEFIDRNNSKDAILIELSVKNSVVNFYNQIHYKLFDYYYEEDSYNDVDVRRVISNSTTDIMNNITKEIKRHNIQFNTHEPLPWKENYK